MPLDPYIEVLKLLADLDAQSKYARDVPIADVPAELICMWFDDLNGGRRDASLSPQDAAKIADFTRFYEARKHRLDTSRGLEALHGSSAWSEVVHEARKTLDALLRDRS